MRKLLKSLDRLMVPLVDCLLAVTGQRRVLLGEWPNGDVVEAALATLKELGAESLGAKPAELYLQSALETQKRTLSRRGVKQTKEDIQLLTKLFEATAQERKKTGVVKKKFML